MVDFLFSSLGARSVGVEYQRYGRRRVAMAGKEVVVAAGAVGSPQLLMLSGIGTHLELIKPNPI